MKLFVQSAPEVWRTNACITGSTSVTSGSFYTEGYAKLVGILYSGASAASINGLKISQSSDYGANYDYFTSYAQSACSGSGYSIEIVGNVAKIEFYTDADGANPFRTSWRLRPI